MYITPKCNAHVARPPSRFKNMDLFQAVDAVGNVLLLTQNYWTITGDTTAQLPGNSTVFYSIPGSQTLVSASVVTTSGQPVYASQGGASTTPTRIALPAASAGNGNVSIVVGDAGNAYLGTVTSTPGTTLALTSTTQPWTLAPATTCYYMRSSKYAYMVWDGSTGFSPVLDVTAASVFEYLNGTLFVHGTYASGKAVSVAAAAGNVVAVKGSVSTQSSPLTSIQPGGEVTLGAQYIADLPSSALTLCPVDTPSRLCTMQVVPASNAPLLTDMICYQWVISAGVTWPLPPLPPSPPPGLTPAQIQALGIAGAALAAAIVLGCLIWYGYSTFGPRKPVVPTVRL